MSIVDPEFEKFARALAEIESANNERAWGDDAGRGMNYLACGRWQMHPAFLWDYGPKEVGVLWSWNTLFEQTLYNFWLENGGAGESQVRIAMRFHLGVEAVKQGRFAIAYADEFNKHYLGLPVGSA